MSQTKPAIILAAVIGCFATPLLRADGIDVSFRVTDSNARQVDDAVVVLIGRYDLPFVLHTTPGSVKVPRVSGGRYEATLGDDAEPLLHANSAVAMIQAPGKRPEMINVPLNRLLADVPLDLTLESAADENIRVVNDRGEPLSGVVLAPALWGQNVVPLIEELPRSEPTSDDGSVGAPWIDPARLVMVYAFGDVIGNQRLPVTAGEGGELQVVTLPATEVQGDWSAPLEMDEYPEFSDTPITIAVTPGTFAIDEPEMSYCWSHGTLHRDGTLSLGPLCSGEAFFHCNLPDSVPIAEASYAWPLEHGESLSLKFVDAVRYRGSVIDDRGEPLPGISVRHFSPARAVRLTGPDGKFTLWCAADNRLSFFPVDVTGRYTTGSLFYISPQELPVDGQVDMKPTAMTPTSAAVGRVVEADGSPVGGARIQCAYSLERFTNDVTLFSNQDGSFRFRDVPQNSAVTLKAIHESGITLKPISTALTSETEFELTLHPRHAVRIRGRISDADGRPVPNAAVILRTRQVHQQDHHGALDARAVAFFDSGEVIAGDSHGTFVSPPIVDWEQRMVSLEVRAPGRKVLRTYWRDASAAGEAESELYFGDLRMQPSLRNTVQGTRVVDAATGMPQAGAQVVCRGAFVPQQRRVTDDDGAAGFSLPNSTVVVAVAAEGYRPRLVICENGVLPPQVQLHSLDEPRPSRNAVNLTRDRRIELAAELLRRVPRPEPERNSFGPYWYYRALAFADFDSLLAAAEAFVEQGGAKEPVSRVLSDFKWLGGDQHERATTFFEGPMKIALLLEQAERAESTEEKLELLGEALLSAEQAGGDTAIYYTARISQRLLEIDEVETAKEVLQNTFDDHEELQAIIDRGERQKEAGLARVFLPGYAVVDPAKAMRLIELTAFANEVAGLQTQALRNAVEYGRHSAAALLKQSGLDRLAPAGMTDGHLTVRHRSFNRGMELAELCPDGPTKADFLFELAKSSDADLQQKAELARSALRMVLDHPGGAEGWAAAKIRQAAQWDENLADEYLFASLWMHESRATILPFHETSQLARHIAAIDADAARALIEPCFEDWSWLFGQYDSSVMFTKVNPLHAAAVIDPEWTTTLVDNLFERHLADHPDRKLAVVYGIINSLTDEDE